MTGGAVEKDSASMQNGFSEWTPTGCDLVWASISTERHIPTECAMYMNKKSEISLLRSRNLRFLHFVASLRSPLRKALLHKILHRSSILIDSTTRHCEHVTLSMTH